MKEIACDVLFEKGHTIAEKIFEGVTYPYEQQIHVTAIIHVVVPFF